MRRFTLDTNTLRPVLRGDPTVRGRIAEVLDRGDEVSLSAVCYYETKRGLLALAASRQLDRFQVVSDEMPILMIDRPVLDQASEIYADLRRVGELVEDADILLAATALVHDATLVTANTRHFERIPGLRLENWLA